MSARIIDGNLLAGQLLDQVRNDVRRFRAAGKPICLAAIRIGNDPAAAAYARSQSKSAAACDIEYRSIELSADILMSGALAAIDQLNKDPNISGIMLHLPVPLQLDAFALQQSISPAKDVEGIGATNLGLMFMSKPALLPCTAAAAMACVESLNDPIEGRRAVIVGRSVIVGKPLTLLLLAMNATVTVCHTRTKDLNRYTRDAELLLVAAGVPGLIGAEHVSKGAVVIDVGIHRVARQDKDGQTIKATVGDVRFDEVAEVASAITPVPGGVGPLTVAMLLGNAVKAAEWAHRDPRA